MCWAVEQEGAGFYLDGLCLFLALEGKDRGFTLHHHSSALPHALSLELPVGEMRVEGWQLGWLVQGG